VIGLVSGNIVQRGCSGPDAFEVADLRTNVILSTVSALFTTGAAVLAVT